MQDIPKLYTALSEWLSCLMLLSVSRPFLSHKGLVPKIVLSLAALALIQLFCGTVSNGLWLLGMLAAFSVMTALIGSSLSLKRWTGLYTAARAFLYAEFAAAFEWEVYHFYFRNNGNILFQHAFCVLVYVLFFLLFYLMESKLLPEKPDRSHLEATRKESLLSLLVMLLVFCFSNLSYVYVYTPFSGTDTRTVFNIRTLIDLSGVLMLYLLNLQRIDFRVKLEVAAIQNLLESQYQQYRQSEENIALVNSKYHDLRNQLQMLRGEGDSAKRTAYLDEIEDGLDRYGSEYKTGSSALDTILTEKGAIALRSGITLTVVADGSLVSHIQVMDLCTIFGNALDNAIEHCSGIEDRAARLIHLSVSSRKGFAVILIENRFEGDIRLEDGLPVSTKGDDRYHGYGIKSIRRAVEKYGGHLNVRIEDGWFRLEMLLSRSC